MQNISDNGILYRVVFLIRSFQSQSSSFCRAFHQFVNIGSADCDRQQTYGCQNREASSHIVRDNNENLWIRKPRQKTKNMCNIPLLDIPLEILRKYADHPTCRKKGVLLPVPCNQKMNSYLKEIADICMIRKNLTTHTARHSYATSVCLANGVSLENVAKMLGHSNIKMTQHYARVLDSSILRDMMQVERAISQLG